MSSPSFPSPTKTTTIGPLTENNLFSFFSFSNRKQPHVTTVIQPSATNTDCVVDCQCCFWIDLYAGPVNYGLAISNNRLIPRGKFHPLTMLHIHPKSNKAFVADPTSLVQSAYHLPLPFESPCPLRIHS